MLYTMTYDVKLGPTTTTINSTVTTTTTTSTATATTTPTTRITAKWKPRGVGAIATVPTISRVCQHGLFHLHGTLPPLPSLFGLRC